MKNEIKFKFDTAHMSPGYLLWQVTMLWQRKIKKELDKLAITHTQFVLMSVLAWLSKDRERVTQADIADHSKTDRMMASKVLRTLELKGLITRIPDPIDTRANTISLTKEGFIILQEAIIRVEEVDAHFFRTDELISEKFLGLIEGNQ